MNKRIKRPWPTKAVMEQIYEEGLWGENGAKFYSGDGSHHPKFVAPYLEVVIAFIASFEGRVSICDLGCGDFNIGKHLLPYVQNYIAIDIVPALVAHLQTTFQHPNLEFQCLDIVEDELPKADVVLLRQVLQHLSNAEIQKIVHKLYYYKYVILTEHLPDGAFIPNIDIISGQSIRLKKQSGVDITASPFHLKAIDTKELLRISDAQYGGVMVTQLFQMF